MGTKMVILATKKEPASGAHLGNNAILGIIMPEKWTEADLTVSVSTELNGTYVPLTDEQGNAITIKAAAKKAIGLTDIALALAPWRYIKLVSSNAQLADRELLLVTKG